MLIEELTRKSRRSGPIEVEQEEKARETKWANRGDLERHPGLHRRPRLPAGPQAVAEQLHLHEGHPRGVRLPARAPGGGHLHEPLDGLGAALAVRAKVGLRSSPSSTTSSSSRCRRGSMLA
ncbi:hypothetical protein PVAP13_5NG039600 [Panicum virgatum]|uniref:Uncharacterized protein n=1 Tax=Panicum virgatum TaxID=38727 RepID=A0A8T0RPJ1_PANVG|nr:hypothetical protein PVAP13_5NG039600 [Panicum virgatum]